MKAALAGLFLAAVSVPALADHHEKKAEGGDASKAEKKGHAKHDKHGKKDKDAKVHCLGVNACKGTSECGVDGAHGCSGQNACKGKGWISLTKKDCKAQKGTVQGKKDTAKAAEGDKKESKTETAPAPAAK
ncbi:MAG: hypothetical protein M0D55_03950 [Elusimicrobiota bacterium]|nr:MAG: hypothetical protein M0D55_03950 [Elusimicrobiota bacterium]